MFDLGVLTLPIVAATGVFILALLTGETIVVDTITVSSNLEAEGINAPIVTQRLTDEVREINAQAQSELESVEVDGTSLQNSVGKFESYFGIDPLVTGTRALLGLVPYYVDGELSGAPTDLTMTVRVAYSDGTVDLSQLSGTADGLQDLLHEAALQVVEDISPYLVSLYWRRIEEAEANYAFPRTNEVLDRYLANRPVGEHFLAYELRGRIRLAKAESQPGITPEEKLAAYAEAERNFKAALLQEPGFLFANINLGVLNSQRGNYEQANTYFAKAVEIDPNSLAARVRWAESLDNQGRVREAAFQWVAAVEIDGGAPALRQELAEDYVILGMVDEARAQIDRAAVLDPIRAASYQRHLDELTGTPE